MVHLEQCMRVEVLVTRTLRSQHAFRMLGGGEWCDGAGQLSLLQNLLAVSGHHRSMVRALAIGHLPGHVWSVCKLHRWPPRTSAPELWLMLSLPHAGQLPWDNHRFPEITPRVFTLKYTLALVLFFYIF